MFFDKQKLKKICFCSNKINLYFSELISKTEHLVKIENGLRLQI